MARTTRSTRTKPQANGGSGETSEKQVKVASTKSKTTRKPATAKTESAKTTNKAAPAKAAAKGRQNTSRKPAARTTKSTAAAQKPKPAKVEAPEIQLDKAASVSSDQVEASKAPDPADVMKEALKIGASAPAAQRFAENIERIEALSQRLMSAFSARGLPNPGVEGPGPELIMTATNAWMKTLTEQPNRLIEQQVNFWGETLKNYATAQNAFARGKYNAVEEEEDTGPRDKRFSNSLWRTHPYFNFVKRQYQINVKALKDATQGLDLSDDIARRRIDWMTNQIVDMISPTNFLATNPDALEKAVETEGESLVKGLENLVRDVELSGGEMVVSLADRDAFTVGGNIGNSEGAVVHRTPMFELIQYKPRTEQVHELPLLIFPPWINKFYILDLKPQNSLIRYMVEQGYSVFVVSWKNPDVSYSEIGMEEYVASYLEAMDVVLQRTGQKKLNAVGYCIAGTTLSLTLALLKQRGETRVNSATLFTTLTDFSDQGEFVTFLQDDFVNGIAEEVARHGLMRAQLMSRTMSFLRANDLVWGPAIRSYMLGETPPAFDLLYWNGDSTNLPGRMAMQYLRHLCQKNDFATDGFEMLGHKLRLSDVTLPICAIACETDHIAPWKDCWRGVAAMGSEDKTFILSESGHIAGIVNPPSKKKYGHYVGGQDYANGFQKWRDDSNFNEGSWWPYWVEWLASRSGKKVPAPELSDRLDEAPGTYVHERAA